MQVSPILFTQFNQNKTAQPSFKRESQVVSNKFETQNDSYCPGNNVKFGTKGSYVERLLQDSVKRTMAKNPTEFAQDLSASTEYSNKQAALVKAQGKVNEANLALVKAKTEEKAEEALEEAAAAFGRAKTELEAADDNWGTLEANTKKKPSKQDQKNPFNT